MRDGDKTAMKDRDEGFGLAAFLSLSGILARLQASGINRRTIRAFSWIRLF